MEEYQFTVKPDRYVYFEIRRGMYVLKESGIISFKQLAQKIVPFGYHSMKYTPGLWKHNTCKTTFALCVNNLGVKYLSQDDENQLVHESKS